jgi:hypothetical protein
VNVALGVFVFVAVGGTGVLVWVGVKVKVAVGGTGVLVLVAVGGMEVGVVVGTVVLALEDARPS